MKGEQRLPSLNMYIRYANSLDPQECTIADLIERAEPTKEELQRTLSHYTEQLRLAEDWAGQQAEVESVKCELCYQPSDEGITHLACERTEKFRSEAEAA